MSYVRDIGECKRNTILGSINYPLVTETIELESDQGVLKKGAILGKVTSSGKYKLVKTTGDDGSQNPNCVLAHDVDTETMTTVTCYTSGKFNLSQVYIEDNDNILKCIEGLRLLNIYVSVEV